MRSESHAAIDRLRPGLRIAVDSASVMRDFREDFEQARARLDAAREYLGIEASRVRLGELEKEVGRPDLWDDPDNARVVTSEFTRVGDDVKAYDALISQYDDVETLWQLGLDEGDDSVEAEVDGALAALRSDLDRVEVQSLFSGDYDGNDAVCEVHSGAGGTDSQDWAEMLLRMQLRWAERRGFQVEIDEVSAGQEAGITSATFIVRGRNAFGWLQSEKGVHRLVRISPFDSQARRHTAFASMEVTPFFEEASSEVEIDEKDLRIDTYRSSGAGGQHVNVTDSAVRITHIPSGVVVSCQNERSQHQNKDRAMQILASKLAEKARLEREAELAAIAGEKSDVGWGSQIRSYVLAPYQMVKDERTKQETGNVQAVLDGDLDNFMESYLRWRRSRG
jgi:peptide chain release factor 2